MVSYETEKKFIYGLNANKFLDSYDCGLSL